VPHLDVHLECSDLMKQKILGVIKREGYLQHCVTKQRLISYMYIEL